MHWKSRNKPTFDLFSPILVFDESGYLVLAICFIDQSNANIEYWMARDKKPALERPRGHLPIPVDGIGRQEGGWLGNR